MIRTSCLKGSHTFKQQLFLYQSFALKKVLLNFILKVPDICHQGALEQVPAAGVCVCVCWVNKVKQTQTTHLVLPGGQNKPQRVSLTEHAHT